MSKVKVGSIVYRKNDTKRKEAVVTAVYDKDDIYIDTIGGSFFEQYAVSEDEIVVIGCNVKLGLDYLLVSLKTELENVYIGIKDKPEEYINTTLIDNFKEGVRGVV